MTYDALLTVLQVRLTAPVKASLTEQQLSGLYRLIAACYQAQRQGSGFVALDTVADIDVASLHGLLPTLIGTVSSRSPLIYCPPFVAFRRPFMAVKQLVDYLTALPLSFTRPSSAALQAIDWVVSTGQAFSAAQQRAAFTAATQPLSLITGGAGTGKTSTLTKALELILLDNPKANLVLTAPTGKAAYRLNDALQQQLSCVGPQVYPLLEAQQAITLHRLLGISEQSGKAYHHADNPINCDVLVIDEASMVGSELFTQLYQALLPHTMVILLGDANQLPPIDSLSFFNALSQLPVGYTPDFCEAVKQDLGQHVTVQSSPLPNKICHLTVAHRFAESSFIEQAAKAVLANQAEALMTLLTSHQAYQPITSIDGFYRQLLAWFPKTETAWRKGLPEQMILCASRQGALGSEQINHYLDQQFRQQFAQGHPMGAEEEWYAGRRVMIVRNDYELSLYNGDIGYCHWQADETEFVVCFDGGRQVPVDWLADNYTLAYAISIHKSQGSEYRQVDIVLGDEASEMTTLLVTKPLLYTAITRAKVSLRLWGTSALIAHALSDGQEAVSPLSYWLNEGF